MVVRTELDTIISLSWIGVLALVLLARALVAWLSFHRATRSEREARRLAEATRSVTGHAGERRGIAVPIPLRPRGSRAPSTGRRAEG